LLDFRGEGVLVTSLGKFRQYNWNQTVGARYGSFINSNVGFVSGGSNWPINGKATEKGVHLTDRLLLGFDGQLYDLGGSKQYQGIVAVTTNGGSDWKPIFNANTAGYNMYFNGISATTQNNIWVVGVEDDNGSEVSYIWNTANGGQTWSQQYSGSKVHLYGVQMIDANNGWAWGFEAPDLTLFTGIALQTTDGGKHWTKHDIRDVIIYRVDGVSASVAYAVGFGWDFATNVYLYNS